MLISEYIERVREDFQALAELTGDEGSKLIQRLGVAFEPALQKHLLDALNAVVQEFNVNDVTPLSVIFEGDEIRLVRLVPLEPEVTAPTSDYSSRIALRLSEDLKESIEHVASDVGSSVNSWIVRSLERSVRSDPSGAALRGRHQLRGKGRA